MCYKIINPSTLASLMPLFKPDLTTLYCCMPSDLKTMLRALSRTRTSFIIHSLLLEKGNMFCGSDRVVQLLIIEEYSVSVDVIILKTRPVSSIKAAPKLFRCSLGPH